MKKILAAVTALLCLFTVHTPLRMYAAEELTFTVDSSAIASRGGTVTVPIIVSGNPGFTVSGLVATYDPNVLEITNVTAPVSDMPLNSQFALTSTPGTQWIHLINTNLADWNGNGTVANMTFNVKTTATVGESPINLAFINTPDGTPSTANGNILRDAKTISGKVNVTATAGGFIGTVADGSANKTAVNQPFGGVPQTGVPGITWAVAGMCASFMVSVGLLVYLARRKKSGSA